MDRSLFGKWIVANPSLVFYHQITFSEFVGSTSILPHLTAIS